MTTNGTRENKRSLDRVKGTNWDEIQLKQNEKGLFV